jgi:hypothetical protein
MEYVYALLQDGGSWEDMVIFVSEEEAISASKRHPSKRVEIFKSGKLGYIPTYSYYRNGILINGSDITCM